MTLALPFSSIRQLPFICANGKEHPMFSQTQKTCEKESYCFVVIVSIKALRKKTNKQEEVNCKVQLLVFFLKKLIIIVLYCLLLFFMHVVVLPDRFL